MVCSLWQLKEEKQDHEKDSLINRDSLDCWKCCIEEGKNINIAPNMIDSHSINRPTLWGLEFRVFS